MILQVDIGHIARAGADPAKYMEKFPGRLVTVHVKDFAKGKPDPVVGEGEVDWPAMFRICEGTGGTEWYIIEDESQRAADAADQDGHREPPQAAGEVSCVDDSRSILRVAASRPNAWRCVTPYEPCPDLQLDGCHPVSCRELRIGFERTVKGSCYGESRDGCGV